MLCPKSVIVGPLWPEKKPLEASGQAHCGSILIDFWTALTLTVFSIAMYYAVHVYIVPAKAFNGTDSLSLTAHYRPEHNQTVGEYFH